LLGCSFYLFALLALRKLLLQPLCPPGFTTSHPRKFCQDSTGDSVTCFASFKYERFLTPWCQLWDEFEYTGFWWDPGSSAYKCPNGSRWTIDPDTKRNFCLWVDAVPNPNLYPFGFVKNCEWTSFTKGFISFSYGINCQSNFQKTILPQIATLTCPNATARYPATQAISDWCPPNGAKEEGVVYNCMFPSFSMPNFARSWCASSRLAILWNIGAGNYSCPAPAVWGSDGIKAQFCQWPKYHSPFLVEWGEASTNCEDADGGLVGFEQSFNSWSLIEYFFAPQDSDAFKEAAAKLFSHGKRFIGK